MIYGKIAIILGAGASKAYQWSYPLLPELLPQMLLYAEKLPDKGRKQRLYLAFALIVAYELQSPIRENGVIPADVIEEQFERVKKLPRDYLNLVDVFRKLEKIDNLSSTRAYWALTYAIGVYMFQMQYADISQSYIGNADNAHGELVYLIDDLLSAGVRVDVIDFNYDCVLEYVRSGLGKPQFGWDVGRKRKVISGWASESTPLSELVENKQFEPPNDEKEYSTLAGLIKPHGDMCTFLRGKHGVFYRGGRHSSTASAVFPKELADISPDDTYLRSSILPPANSRFRHKSDFYRQEEKRLVMALNDSMAVVIIGWSASGTDDYYERIFRKVCQDKSSDPVLFVIDYSQDGSQDANLRKRLQKLFCDRAVLKDVQMCGFNETAVGKLSLFSPPLRILLKKSCFCTEVELCLRTFLQVTLLLKGGCS